MKIKKELNQATIDESLESKDLKTTSSVKIDGTTFEVSENTLILRKRGSGYKEKILIDLQNITATKIKKTANTVLLVLSIFFLVVGGGATYPLYLYVGNWAWFSLGIGGLLFIIFLAIYLSTRNIRISIYLKSGEPIKRKCKDTKLFEKINDFFDEIFYKKHK